MFTFSSRSPRLAVHAAIGCALAFAAVPDTATAQVDGRNVVRVHSGHGSRITGIFEQEQGSRPSVWAEKTVQGVTRFRFAETHRDQWSVYLYDASRRINLRVDLWLDKIVYSDPGQTFNLYDIVRAESATTSTNSQPPRNPNAVFERSRSLNYSVGSGRATASVGAGADFRARARQADARARAYAQLGVQVLGFRGSLRGELNATARGNQGPSVGASFDRRLLLNGAVILSRSDGFSAEVTRGIGPYYPIRNGIRYRMWLGPVPVSISGNAGIGGEVGARINGFDPIALRLRASTDAAMFASGYLSAGVDILFARAGISADLRFGELGGEGSATIHPEGMNGQLRGYFTPVRLALSLYAQLWTFWSGWETWRTTLFSWSARSRTLATQAF